MYKGNETQTCYERHAELLRCGLVAGPGKPHEGDIEHFGYADDSSCEGHVSCRHAIDSAMGFYLLIPLGISCRHQRMFAHVVHGQTV